ncbi:uncharacterized protein EI97DRAFT_437492 [Westerdykella ornata]|uniref:Uncharacterized protein n=1 Tax=Westerdykella ornata TaxID=318751 RepID=A0A6A6J6G5_WESOR|nr:uncharacterized protein EI97DRAFT_437492 [Westerdykella ornata]KAF2271804.1 hypothetical protein EI97DRAFT_437492 [Westerdykella ornata]
MSSKDAHLYGQRPASRTKTKEISSSSTLAFSSTLSNLIKSASADINNKPTGGRARPKKDDIFQTHNKGVSKRAEKDLEESAFTQKHRKRTVEEREDDEANWKRAKRRMEEKARLYNALKRGDIEDLDDRYGVDFDRKWAEARESGKPLEEEESDSESAVSVSEEELIEYTDEFGRTRKGTRAEVAREERRRRTQAVAAEPDRFTARPSMPDEIIYGDRVQAEAFNPDATIAEQMAALAAKRDKEPTPPPDEHFDANREKRQRGTGFFQFSKDEEERREQMANLEKERLETEKAREARKKQMEERAKLVEERRRKIKEKRAMGQADRFLDALGSELLKEQE